MMLPRRELEVLAELEVPRSRTEVRERLEISASRLSQIIRKLSKLGMVEVDKGIVRASPKGVIVLRFCEALAGYEEFLGRVGNLLNGYDLSGIPDWLISRLYELKNIEIVEVGTLSDLRSAIFNELRESELARVCVSDVPGEFAEPLLNLAKSGVLVQAVLWERSEVLDRFRKSDQLRGLELYVSREDFGFFLGVTDSSTSIILRLRSGVIDYRRLFVCKGKDCVRWGKNLFEHVLEDSTRIV